MTAHYDNNDADTMRAIKRLRRLISITLVLIAGTLAYIAWTFYN